MANELLVVSLGRVLADEVRVEADEAHALIQHIWQYLRVQRANDGGLPMLPALDTVGLTAFGDVQVHPKGTGAAGVVRPPHQVARELADLLVKLVRSGRDSQDGGLDAPAAACVAVADRTLNRLAPSGRPITAPDALLRALEAFRPRDASAALAALYARWMRTTDSGRVRTAASRAVPGGALALGIGTPRPSVAARTRTEQGAEPGASPRLLLAAAAPAAPAAPPKPRTRVVVSSAPAPLEPPVAGVHVNTPSSFTPAVPGLRRPGRLGFAFRFGTVALVAGLGAAIWAWQPHVATRVAGRLAAVLGVQENPQPGPDGASAAAPGVAALSGTDVDVAPAGGARVAPTAARARRVLRAEAPGAAPYSPSFDPQTHAILFHAGRDHTALREASLDAEGEVAGTSTVREDGSRSYHAEVSPDGSRLAFDSDVDGPRGVYVSNRDGSDARRVSGPGHASVPSWSPDGEYVAFARAEPRRPRVWNIWTVHLATGRLERRTAHQVGQPWGASWFPDGQRFAYSLEGELVVRDLQTGATRIYRSPLRGRLVRTPAVSPDGRRIVFQVRHDGAWVLDLESGTTTRILADASAEEFAWSPDGRRVAYHSLRGGEWGIWLLDLAP